MFWQSAIHRSFAIVDNLGEVSAKAQVIHDFAHAMFWKYFWVILSDLWFVFQIQTVCFDNLGLMLAAILNILCRNSQRFLSSSLLSYLDLHGELWSHFLNDIVFWKLIWFLLRVSGCPRHCFNGFWGFVEFPFFSLTEYLDTSKKTILWFMTPNGQEIPQGPLD